MRFALILLIIPTLAFAQSDWTRWKAVKPSYKMSFGKNKEVEKSDGSFAEDVLIGARKIYAFFISDLDGDNCPFYPSCSHFFIRAVKATGLIQGLLMFADRFTRDTNIFKSLTQYPSKVAGRLYDPIFLYKLDESEINIKKLKYPANGN
jgi:putative component of membrane protein insertase Oxa1/YidC/SpoIIIJ protein YidD